MLGASRHNEGKLHLGYVYGAAQRPETHRLLASGSLRFLAQLEALTGFTRTSFVTSGPFTYVVPRDSLVSVDEIWDHMQRIDEMAAELCESQGLPLLPRTQRVDEARRREQYVDDVLAAFDTPEVAVDPARVSDLVAAAVLAHPAIRFRGGQEIDGAEPVGSRYRIAVRSDDGPQQVEFEWIVNALWEGRVALDRDVGLTSPFQWSRRWKATVTIDQAGDAPIPPSTTPIVGPYGDLVRYDNGRIYVSWYPVCRLSMQPEETRAAAPKLNQAEIGELRRSTLSGLAALVPAVAELEGLASTSRVGGGFIMAVGQTDIDDRDSALHDRHRIGVERAGGWTSISTGKFCTAPTFGIEAAAELDTLINGR